MQLGPAGHRRLVFNQLKDLLQAFGTGKSRTELKARASGSLQGSVLPAGLGAVLPSLGPSSTLDPTGLPGVGKPTI